MLFQLEIFPAATIVLRSEETMPALLTPIPTILWLS